MWQSQTYWCYPKSLNRNTSTQSYINKYTAFLLQSLRVKYWDTSSSSSHWTLGWTVFEFAIILAFASLQRTLKVPVCKTPFCLLHACSQVCLLSGRSVWLKMSVLMEPPERQDGAASESRDDGEVEDGRESDQGPRPYFELTTAGFCTKCWLKVGERSQLLQLDFQRYSLFK